VSAPELTLEDLEACEGLAATIATARQLAVLDRPVLIRGETTTARALARTLTDRALDEVFCALVPDAVGELRGVLQRMSSTLRRAGAVVFIEADQLSTNDQNLLSVMCRDQIVDSRGTPMRARLVCQYDPRRRTYATIPGACLELDIPPLGERADDACVLFERLVARQLGQTITLDNLARDAMAAYSWPGDVPELMGCAESVALSWDLERRSPVTARELGIPFEGAARKRARTQALEGRTLGELLDEYEQEVLAVVMARFQGNKSQAARDLGISRSYLIQKCRKYGIE
jgi:DNA-binding NtrC family response regulator